MALLNNNIQCYINYDSIVISNYVVIILDIFTVKVLMKIFWWCPVAMTFDKY